MKISDESFWQSEDSPLGCLWLLRQGPVTKDKEGGTRVDITPPQSKSLSGVSLITGTSGGQDRWCSAPELQIFRQPLLRTLSELACGTVGVPMCHNQAWSSTWRENIRVGIPVLVQISLGQGQDGRVTSHTKKRRLWKGEAHKASTPSKRPSQSQVLLVQHRCSLSG